MSDLDPFYVDIHCVDLVELVTEYLDGVLSANDVERFEEHVDDCEDCRVYVDQIKMTITLTTNAAPTDGSTAIELPDNFDELVQLLQDRKN